MKQVTLHRVTAADAQELADLVARDVPQLPHYKGITIDKNIVVYTITNNVNNEGFFAGWVLKDTNNKIVGGSGGYCVPMMFSTDRMTGDIYLSIDPEYRNIFNVIKLIDAYKAWAIARQAKIIAVTHTGGYRIEEMDRLLRSQGFEKVGSIYHLRRD